mmetsp:Transcript_6387/g.9036  ORF Transcript_6387/g.9036 Transcript_6387/m.9036 type:complete len:337 (+) Transcript_6387:865-1875(+)
MKFCSVATASLCCALPSFLVGSTLGFQGFNHQKTFVTRKSSTSSLNIASTDYLSSLSNPAIIAAAATTTTTAVPPPSTLPPPQQDTSNDDDDTLSFHHASRSYFDIPLLTPKGPRANADVGTPHDSSRPFTEVGAISSGSWWCAQGGWPSPNQRATTEIFYVLEGHGCLTDRDGTTQHYFGPGDTVILPKGWSGRWDVLQDIHKIWFVHDHPNIEFDVNKEIIPAIITPYVGKVEPLHTKVAMEREAGDGFTHILYDNGPTTVGTSSRDVVSDQPIVNLQRTVCFHVLEGVFFLTNADDGTAQRCVAGDTIVLPKGWSGQRDVVEPVRELWVTVQE